MNVAPSFIKRGSGNRQRCPTVYELKRDAPLRKDKKRSSRRTAEPCLHTSSSIRILPCHRHATGAYKPGPIRKLEAIRHLVKVRTRAFLKPEWRKEMRLRFGSVLGIIQCTLSLKGEVRT